MAPLRWHKVVVTLLLALCSGVTAQDPFVTYNKTIPLGDSGFVSWDDNLFSAPVNLWLQQLAPNASATQVPLDYSNTKGFFLWEAGSNLGPGQYFYQLQGVGGTGIIYKSNPLMIVCSDCPTNSNDVPTASSAASSNDDASSGRTETASPYHSAHLSPGAAAGIGVGGSLGLVAIVLGLMYFFRRRRKQKQGHYLARPSMTTLSQPPSFGAASPPPNFWSPHGQAYEVKGFSQRPPMAVAPKYSSQRIPSHELDSTGPQGSSYFGPDCFPSNTTAPRIASSQVSPNFITPEPWHSPREGLQHPYPSPSQPLSSPYGQKSPGSNHEDGSYYFPSRRVSPNLEAESFQWQEWSQPGATSPHSQQHLMPRRVVGLNNLRNVL